MFACAYLWMMITMYEFGPVSIITWMQLQKEKEKIITEYKRRQRVTLINPSLNRFLYLY